MSQIARNYRRAQPTHLHDVEENARRLGVLYSLEIELTRLVGCWVARVPELAEKLTLGKVCFEHADAAKLLGDRLEELRVSEEELAPLRARTASALKALEQAEDASLFLAGLFRVVEPALLAGLQRQLDSAPPYVDDPSVRILRRTIKEHDALLASGLALLSERGISWGQTSDFEADLRDGLWNLDAPGGGLVEGFVGSDPIPQPQPVWPADVNQLPYESPMPPYPEEFDAAMRRCIHDLVFSETEALDTFGRYVYDFAPSDLPWQFHHEAARIAWDEARHIELLLNVLDRYDGKVGDFPAKSPGYEEYASQEGQLEKIIMVNVIAEGEVSTDTQTQHRDAFRALGDELSALLKDYEMADEVVHGRFGLRWSRWLAEREGADYAAAYHRAYASLEDFKSQHAAADTESPIPLVRLGVDETGDKRVVNVEAKRLVGFTEDEIERISAHGSSTGNE